MLIKVKNSRGRTEFINSDKIESMSKVDGTDMIMVVYKPFNCDRHYLNDIKKPKSNTLGKPFENAIERKVKKTLGVK